MSEAFLREFIDLTPADEQGLATVAGLLSQRVGLDGLVSIVYERLLSYPETARFFRGQDMEVRKRTLAAYLARLLAGGFDAAYAREHAEVGRRHERVEVPFEFLVATYGWVRSLVPPIVLAGFPDEPQRAAALLAAFNKALDLDLCLLAKGYCRGGAP